MTPAPSDKFIKLLNLVLLDLIVSINDEKTQKTWNIHLFSILRLGTSECRRPSWNLIKYTSLQITLDNPSVDPFLCSKKSYECLFSYYRLGWFMTPTPPDKIIKLLNLSLLDFRVLTNDEKTQKNWILHFFLFWG